MDEEATIGPEIPLEIALEMTDGAVVVTGSRGIAMFGVTMLLLAAGEG